MEALAQLSKEIFYTLVMTMPRIVGAMTALTFMSPNLLGGRFPRNGIAAAFSLTAYPVVSEQIEQAYLPTLLFAAAAIKELLLGMLIGSVVMVVFWGIQAVGHFIDNQRGATMASTLDPFVGEQASPLALFMMQSLVAVFFCTGLFLGFLKGIYMSYVAWPATSFWPTMDRQVASFSEVPGPPVVVFQDLDSPSVAATFGEVMCSVYQTFGAVGLVTSGTGRDLDQVRDLGFPAFTNGAIASHGYNHMVDLGRTVHVGGIAIFPGYLLHGDCNGVAVVPNDIASDVAHVCEEFVAAEQVILDYLKTDEPTPAGLAEARAESSRLITALGERVRGK